MKDLENLLLNLKTGNILCESWIKKSPPYNKENFKARIVLKKLHEAP